MIQYHARWILPVGAAPIRDGTVVVDGDRIAFVGPRAAAPPGSRSDEDLGDAVIVPGLVNAHVHLDLAAFAGVLHGASFFTWVRTLVRGLEETMSDAALADVAHWSVADQLAHGVTTLGHTGPGALALDAITDLGARGIAYLEVFGPDPLQVNNSMTGLRARVDAARKRETDCVRVGVSPHAPYSVSDALYRAVTAYAQAESLPMAVHIAESADEHQLVAAGAGAFADFLRARDIEISPRAATPIALLDHCGVLAARPLCIHAIDADANDVRRIADAGATVAHCPRANAWFDHGRAPLRSYRDAGVTVGLGTDSAASNYGVRLLAEAHDAADPALTWSERLDLATRGGAHALGFGDRTGALAAGMQADLAVFTAENPDVCDADPARYVVEHCAIAPALLTVVAGVERARKGRALALRAATETRMARHREGVRAWASGLASASHTILDSGP